MSYVDYKPLIHFLLLGHLFFSYIKTIYEHRQMFWKLSLPYSLLFFLIIFFSSFLKLFNSEVHNLLYDGDDFAASGGISVESSQHVWATD